MKTEKLQELKNEVIAQYSGNTYTKSDKIIDNMKQTEWWEKERYRLKIQYTVACIVVGFALACVLLVLAITFTNHRGTNINHYSLISVLLSLLIVLSIFNKTVQRKKIYKILEKIKNAEI